MPTEEERASLFRQQCVNRAVSRQQQAAALTGDPVRAAAVNAAWSPLLPSPLDGWDCPPEDVEPPRPAWVARVPSDIELPEHLKNRQRPY